MEDCQTRQLRAHSHFKRHWQKYMPCTTPQRSLDKVVLRHDTWSTQPLPEVTTDGLVKPSSETRRSRSPSRQRYREQCPLIQECRLDGRSMQRACHYCTLQSLSPTRCTPTRCFRKVHLRQPITEFPRHRRFQRASGGLLRASLLTPSGRRKFYSYRAPSALAFFTALLTQLRMLERAGGHALRASADLGCRW